ncbi:MAG: thiamine pyrophosphate-binding protein [Myxococcota bacterium]
MGRDVGDRLVEALLAGGIDAMFGVPGGQTLPLYAAARRRGMRHVIMRDERAAACAADACARVSGRIGVCDATVGPGATNLVSGLAEAFASSIPLLAIIADVPTSWGHLRRRGVASQALEQAPLLAPVTKWVARVERADALDEMLDHALRVATTGRPGPVVLEIPDDVFQADPGAARRRFEPDAFASPRQRPAPARDALESALRLIAAAHRPLVLAGGGVHLSGAAEAVTRLAETTGIPVATTLNGKGALDEHHPLAAGVVGIFGDVRAGRALAAADLVLVLGSKLDQLSTFTFRLPGPGQRVIHVDVDAEEIGRTAPVELGLCADVRETALALADRLKGGTLALERGWQDGLETGGQPGTRTDDPAIPPERVVATLSDALGPGDVLLCDASLASGWGGQHYRVKHAGRGYLAPRGLAGIGWAGGAAIGARMGLAPQRKLVCLAGDGGFSYAMAELETAVRWRLDLVYVVLNNASLAWIRHTEQFKGMEPTSDLGEIDFAAVARAMGAAGERIESIAALPDALARALERGGPTVLDVRTSRDASPMVGLRAVGAGDRAATRRALRAA